MASVAEEIEAADEPLSGEWRRRYAEMGFLSVNVAADLGGLGLGNLEALIVLEEFARVSSAVAFPIFESCVGPVRAIEHFAGPELKRRVIPRVCAGEIVVAVAMSEPEAGTALTDLVTQGVIEGQHIVLNGTKRWCSGGGHADGYVVYCRLSEAPGAKGIGAVYVERDRPGVSFGKRERLMGFRGIPSADVVFEDARVPAANLIVPAGGFRKGFIRLTSRLHRSFARGAKHWVRLLHGGEHGLGDLLWRRAQLRYRFRWAASGFGRRLCAHGGVPPIICSSVFRRTSFPAISEPPFDPLPLPASPWQKPRCMKVALD